MLQRDQIFVSYSHADEEYLNRLRVHFRPLERQYSIKLWSDKNIKPSQQWREEISNALQRSAVAIFLVSADFLFSDFIHSEELPPLLDAAQAEGVKILALILKPCAFNSSSLAKYQAVNDPSKPLISLDEAQKEQKWVELAEAAKTALAMFQAQNMAKKVAKQDKVAERDDLSHSSNIRWDKVATLFSLGQNLAALNYITQIGIPPEYVLRLVDDVIQSVRSLGLPSESLPMEALVTAREVLIQLEAYSFTRTEEGMSTDDRMLLIEGPYKRVRQLCDQALYFFNELARYQEPDFGPLRSSD